MQDDTWQSFEHISIKICCLRVDGGDMERYSDTVIYFEMRS